jgi:hypothetical protein
VAGATRRNGTASLFLEHCRRSKKVLQLIGCSVL